MPLDTRVSLAPLLGRAKRENRCLSSFPIFVFMLVSVRRPSWSLSYLTQKLGTLVPSVFCRQRRKRPFRNLFLSAKKAFGIFFRALQTDNIPKTLIKPARASGSGP